MHLLINCSVGVLCYLGINSFEVHLGSVSVCVVGVDWDKHVWVSEVLEKPGQNNSCDCWEYAK